MEDVLLHELELGTIDDEEYLLLSETNTKDNSTFSP